MLAMIDESGGVKKAVLGVAVCVFAVLLVLASTILSVFLIYAIRTAFTYIVRAIATIAEVFIAFVAAISSGVTVTLAVVAAAGSASFTFPAACVEGRVLVAALVSAASMVVCMALVLSMAAEIRITWDVGVAVVTAAAVAVAGASSWAVGVMSLIERETHQTGIRMSSIMDATRKNSYRLLRLLLKLHSGKQQELDLILVQAIKAGFPESTLVLLDAGADPNTRDAYENTPLLLASEMGHEPLVRLLLQRGARVHACSNTGGGGRGSSLHHAAKWGYQHCMKLLLEHGADVNAQDGLWRTPLMLAARYAKNPQHIICSLLEAGAQVNVVGCERRTVLHYAAGRGINVQVLVVAGADVHAQDSEGNTPLQCASIEGHVKVVTQLLSEGANVNALNYQRRSSLHLAAMRGHTDCVHALLCRGGQLERVDASGHLPIYYACQGNHAAIVHHFITHNSAVPGSCLEVALQEHHFALAQLLIQAGVDLGALHRFLLHDVPPAISGPELLFLQDCVSAPRALAHRCRLVVRTCMSRRYFQRHVTRLPLPKPVQRYVAMMDLANTEPTVCS